MSSGIFNETKYKKVHYKMSFIDQ